ncbi:MFS transporter [Streptomyces sp.]|uniref:MFS transporter n=1 Tax=Streptomyces sp. TaxID=1931 RepID=UPI002F40F344
MSGRAERKREGLLATLRLPHGLPRALLAITVVYALGSGFYSAGSVIFFTAYVGLPGTDVALGMSIAALVAFALQIPLGRLADRVGGHRAWLLGSVCQAVLFGAYPFLRGFWPFVAAMSAVAVAAALGMLGRGRYLGEAIPAEYRIRANGYLRSVLNIGFAIGAAGSGVLAGLRSPGALIALVVINAVAFAVVSAVLLRLPAVDTRPGKSARSGRAALTDAPFIAASVLAGLFLTSDILLTVVLPLWILQGVHAPAWLISASLLVNMVMVTFLQVWSTQSIDDVPTGARGQRRAGLLIALGCAVVGATAYTSPLATIALVVAAVVVLTFGEMLSSAASWALSYGLSPADRRGEYLAVYGWGADLTLIAGPAAMTAAALAYVPGGWIAFAALFLVLAIATGPVVRWAIRTRPTEPDPARTADPAHVGGVA